MTEAELILREIRAKLEQITAQITGGEPPDYPAYREFLGHLRALRSMEQYVIDLNKPAED